MGFVAAAIVGVFSVAASAVAGVVAGILAPLGAILHTVVSAVGAMVGSIASTIGSILAPVINTVGGITEGISSVIKGAVEVLRTKVAEPLANIVKYIKAGITKVANAITAPFKPILDPIKETLIVIHKFVADTSLWVETQLKPVADLINIVNSISSVVVVKRLLDGTMDVSKIIGELAAQNELKTAKAIATLWRETVQMGRGIMESARETYTVLANTIDSMDERLHKDIELSIAYAKETIQGEIDKVRNPLSERITAVELAVAGAERRTMDLPVFQQMLIKAID